MKASKLIFVTGATGNVGRQVVSQLARTGVRVRALSRNPQAARLPDGVEVVRGDPSKPETLDGRLAGVDAVFLVWRSLTAEAIPALLDRISRHARRIVFLSSSAVRDDMEQQTNPIARVHAEIEQSIRKSGLEWTFLRPGGFSANALSWWAPQIRAGNVVRRPYGAAASVPIHERDIAAVAVPALTVDGHAGATYVLTGPQALTHSEQVRAIGEAIGRLLRFEEIPPHGAREEMLSAMPPVIVDLLLDAWARMATEPALVTATAAEITGAPARTFREWAIDHYRDFEPAAAALRDQHDADWPDVTRGDAGVVLVSEWSAGTAQRQRAVADALVTALDRPPWPEGLLSVNLFGSSDGSTVLNYAQWRSEEAYEAFVHRQRQSLVGRIDRGVTGIERTPAVRYRPYRSGVRTGASPPGCAVIVSVEFDGPDERRHRRWVDTVFEALEAETDLHHGGISGHFHISTDGRRVLNNAQWTSEEAHREAIERSGQGAVGSGPKRREVQEFPGVLSSGFKRYRLLRSLSAAAGDRTQNARIA